MGLSKAARDAGYRPVPQPSEHTALILRRVAGGHLMVTHAADGTQYCYEDGTPVRDSKGREIKPRAIRAMIKNRWLIPIEGESFLQDGPPQRYRARSPADGPLPKWRAK